MTLIAALVGFFIFGIASAVAAGGRSLASDHVSATLAILAIASLYLAVVEAAKRWRRLRTDQRQ